jgi:hypothetical protein
MAAFFLKMFTRRNPNSSVGEVVGEWSIEAGGKAAAVRVAMRKLDQAGFRAPDDFAILRDDAGKKIWDYVVPRESDLK